MLSLAVIKILFLYMGFGVYMGTVKAVKLILEVFHIISYSIAFQIVLVRTLTSVIGKFSTSFSVFVSTLIDTDINGH